MFMFRGKGRRQYAVMKVRNSMGREQHKLAEFNERQRELISSVPAVSGMDPSVDRQSIGRRALGLPFGWSSKTVDVYADKGTRTLVQCALIMKTAPARASESFARRP